MYWSRILLLVACILSRYAQGQELYPYAEPASTLPHKMVGVKLANEIFSDISTKTKYYTGLRFMYGIHRYCTVGITSGISNHHLKRVPRNYLYYLLNHHSRRYPDYPVLLEGLHVNAKWRVFSHDKSKSHLRVALLTEASKSFSVHDEAEANLMTDNSGYGVHLIVTRLYKRWAINLQGGMIYPRAYRQLEASDASDFYIRYSDVLQVMVSNGFRIYPRTFRNFSQTNINLYAELLYKNFGDAHVEVEGRDIDFGVYREVDRYLYGSMTGNEYLDLRTYIQFIFNSQNRLEFGIVSSLYSRSYLHNYPMVSVQFQKFIFARK